VARAQADLRVFPVKTLQRKEIAAARPAMKNNTARRTQLKIRRSVARNQSKDKGQNDGANYRDDDRHQEPVRPA